MLNSEQLLHSLLWQLQVSFWLPSLAVQAEQHTASRSCRDGGLPAALNLYRLHLSTHETQETMGIALVVGANDGSPCTTAAAQLTATWNRTQFIFTVARL